MIDKNLKHVVGAISDTSAHATPHPVSLDGCNMASVTLSWASGTSPVGTFKVQATNHEAPSADAHWSDLEPSLDISGNSGSLSLSDGLAAYRFIRAHFQLASGDATFTVYFKAKGI